MCVCNLCLFDLIMDSKHSMNRIQILSEHLQPVCNVILTPAPNSMENHYTKLFTQPCLEFIKELNEQFNTEIDQVMTMDRILRIYF